MILQPVYPNRAQLTYVQCRHCGKMTKDTEAFADLAGEPFKDFYCKACAEELTKEQG